MTWWMLSLLWLAETCAILAAYAATVAVAVAMSLSKEDAVFLAMQDEGEMVESVRKRISPVGEVWFSFVFAICGVILVQSVAKYYFGL